MGQFSLLYPIKCFLLRWRYPVCCPEDISKALGLTLTNQLSFDELLCKLTSPHCHVNSLYKFMTRSSAETAFHNALKIEVFPHSTLVGYYFSEGWMEFNLHFDDENRLRRLYVQHQCIPESEGVEISLKRLKGMEAIPHENASVASL